MKIAIKIIRKNLMELFKSKLTILINEIKRSEWVDDKMIGCAAIILTGLSYQDEIQDI